MKKVLVLLAVFLFITGCEKNDVILNSEGDQLHKANVFTISGYVDGLTTWPLGADKPFRHLEGSGQSTPGGNVQIIINYLIGSYTPPTGTSIFGSAEIITQSGDKIFAINGNGSFSITGTLVTFTATAVIAGGTGEYDNIMGSLTYTGSFNQLDGITHAEWTGTYTHEKPIGGTFTGENVTVSGSCLPGYVRRLAEGKGNVIHLGKTSFKLEHCFNPLTGIILSGDDFLMGANGDKLYTTHIGYTLPVPGTSTYSVYMFSTITGGEGKFANASGSMWLKATQETSSPNCYGTMDGVIKY
jgi:hypothetical protein